MGRKRNRRQQPEPKRLPSDLDEHALVLTRNCAFDAMERFGLWHPWTNHLARLAQGMSSLWRG